MLWQDDVTYRVHTRETCNWMTKTNKTTDLPYAYLCSLDSGQSIYVNLVFFCMKDFPLFFYCFSTIHSSMDAQVIDHFCFVALNSPAMNWLFQLTPMPCWVRISCLSTTSLTLRSSKLILCSSCPVLKSTTSPPSTGSFGCRKCTKILAVQCAHFSWGVSFRPSQLTEKEMCVYSNSWVCTYL